MFRPMPDHKPKIQYAALPWRRCEDGAVEVLVITSRETRRWVIPKGWPINGLEPGAAAAQEAFEEAGVSGAPPGPELGVYHYDKRLKSGPAQFMRVSVFPLEVGKEHNDWPEKAQREKRWTTAAQAADLVDEPELRILLRAFAP